MAHPPERDTVENYALHLGAKGRLVLPAKVRSTAMSAVNWAEVLSRLVDSGAAPQEVRKQLISQGLLGGALRVVPFSGDEAIEVAALRFPARTLGLSLGDRACLALGRRLRLPVITADRSWAGLHVDVEIRLIRG